MSVIDRPTPETFPFDSLPDELKLQVFSYLEVPDVASCSRVCIRWNNFCNQGIVWKALSLGNLNFLRPENIKQFLSRHAITSEKKLLQKVDSFLKEAPLRQRSLSRFRVISPYKKECDMCIDYGHVADCDNIEEQVLYVFTKPLGEFTPAKHSISHSKHDHTSRELETPTTPRHVNCSVLEINHNLPLEERQIERLLSEFNR